MILRQLIANIFLFFSGVLGIFLNRRHVLLVLICIEIILLAINLTFLIFSVHLDDMYGQIFSFFVLAVAASESAIGLAIIILYYRTRGSISVLDSAVLKG